LVAAVVHECATSDGCRQSFGLSKCDRPSPRITESSVPSGVGEIDLQQHVVLMRSVRPDPGTVKGAVGLEGQEVELRATSDPGEATLSKRAKYGW
jgi:hypothetical protein